ncbi:signal transduction histidine kinase [Ectothiorhodospira mobilis]|uniref:histidine kinase n=1 Tax=Ectothiorhodospira mobilis TaxID=195064 RepID=A0A1I4RBM2_ECTMO|nr:ATP-binding protein [Ectothiorhodospira mobilis]SFM49651.1 signal transduction histidine kinase [Ectothiorhodospira mobilis]
MRGDTPQGLTAGRSPEETWRALRLFSFYRLFVAGLLLALMLLGTGPEALGSSHPRLFLAAAALYVALSLAFGTGARLRRPAADLQIPLQGTADVLLITVLTHASGGVDSGLGMLAIPAVAGLALLAPGRPALFFAALASLALLISQLRIGLTQPSEDAGLTQAGLLGAGLFATALLALVLSRRARESEALARRHSIDLANLAELNAHIIERMQSGIIVVNDDGQVYLINEAAWALLGHPAATTPHRLARLAPGVEAAWRRWLQAAPAGQDLHTIPADARGPELRVRFTRLGVDRAVGTLIFMEDTAELRRQMQAAKLASLGRLTASIAHEIRNPLGAISHAAQLLGESETLEAPDRRLAGIIQDQSRRMNRLIENVLGLSRRAAPRSETLDLGPWLETFARDFRAHHHLTPAQLEVRLGPEVLQARFDPEQLHQVLWNLCLNALRYGTRDGEPPQIRIQGGMDTPASRPFVDVQDAGHGVRPAILRQLFEPFVTSGTRGTGLGLYIARELCENNGGTLEYLPLPTGGSCFRIRFPAQEPRGSVPPA